MHNARCRKIILDLELKLRLNPNDISIKAFSKRLLKPNHLQIFIDITQVTFWETSVQSNHATRKQSALH